MKITILVNKVVNYDKYMMERTLKVVNKYMTNHHLVEDITVRWLNRSKVIVHSNIIDLEEKYEFQDKKTLFAD